MPKLASPRSIASLPFALIKRAQFSVIALVALALLTPGAATADTAKLRTGTISGETESSGVTVYRGIPFAAPPVGDLRWKPPQPASKWKGVRDTTQFSAACPQPDTLAKMMGEELPTLSEDCLYLNVWTRAKKNAKRPVMVWIHGGGLNLGWGHQRGYDGTNFAKRDVVFVSINYRLGPLGFLAHPKLSSESKREVSGNYGLLDQLAALKWVKKNIKQFGGDPNNVTIFGESAGGTSVNALVASPLSKGLFHRAISQSAWVTDTNYAKLDQALPTVASAEDLGQQWARQVHPTDQSLKALRAVGIEAIIEGMGNYPVAVTVDGWFMPDLSKNIFARGEQQNVPLIAGTNQDEGTMFLDALPFETPAAFATAMRGMYGNHADKILSLYPAVDKKQLLTAKNAYITDNWFVMGTRGMLAGMQKVSANAYQYHFTRPSTALPAWGAHHGLEIGYAFGNLDSTQQLDTDKVLSDAMIQYWVAFAATGNPNVAGLPVWPEYDADLDKYLELGDSIAAGSGLRKVAVDTLNTIDNARW